MPHPLYSSEGDPVSIVQEAGRAPGLVWTGAENIVPSRIRSPDRPASNESLYHVSCPSPLLVFSGKKVV
jgi:hypothetical protein